MRSPATIRGRGCVGEGTFRGGYSVVSRRGLFAPDGIQLFEIVVAVGGVPMRHS
jgi:hypothetical protein